MTGNPVDVVLYDDGHTRLFKTVIEIPIPLRLKVLEGAKDGIRTSRRVMLLTHSDGIAMRADGHLNRSHTDENGTFLEIGNVHWEVLDRRRHIRVPLNVPVVLKSIVDGDAEPEVDHIVGTTLDLSISGAFVQTAELPPEGALVEFVVDLKGEKVRTLAVVAHVARERSGVGLHFVEYLDNARYLLHGFLSEAA